MSGLDKKIWDEWKVVSDSICRLDGPLKLNVLFTWRHFESSQVDKSSMLITWLSFVGWIWWIGTNRPTKYGLLHQQCGFTPNEKSPNWKTMSIETAERAAESEWNQETLRGIFQSTGWSHDVWTSSTKWISRSAFARRHFGSTRDSCDAFGMNLWDHLEWFTRNSFLIDFRCLHAASSCTRSGEEETTKIGAKSIARNVSIFGLERSNEAVEGRRRNARLGLSMEHRDDVEFLWLAVHSFAFFNPRFCMFGVVFIFKAT